MCSENSDFLNICFLFPCCSFLFWHNICHRVGIEEAKKAGKHLGRPKVTFTDQFVETSQQWKASNITAVKAIELADIGKSTFYRLVKKYEENQ